MSRNKAITRFEIQFAEPDGAYVRLISRRDKALTHVEALKSIREFLEIIEVGIAARKKADKRASS